MIPFLLNIYCFFNRNVIPNIKLSLKKKKSVLKPRINRGHQRGTFTKVNTELAFISLIPCQMSLVIVNGKIMGKQKCQKFKVFFFVFSSLRYWIDYSLELVTIS